MNNIFQYLRDNLDVEMTIQANENAFAGRRGYTITLRQRELKVIKYTFVTAEPKIPHDVHIFLMCRIKREWGDNNQTVETQPSATEPDAVLTCPNGHGELQNATGHVYDNEGRTYWKVAIPYCPICMYTGDADYD